MWARQKLSVTRNNKFSKKFRLSSKDQYAQVFQKGERVPFGPIVFLVKKNNCDYSRLGFAIAKRHVKNAVERNKLRRLIREGFRINKDPLKGLDIVVLTRNQVNQGAGQFKVDKIWCKLKKSSNICL